MAGDRTSASREAARRKQAKMLDRLAQKLADEIGPVRPGDGFHVSLAPENDPKLRAINTVLERAAKRKVN